jgi:hypothetical protein
MTMKNYVVLIVGAVLLSACGTKPVAMPTVEEEEKEEQSTQEVVDNTIFLGTVKLYESACNVLIDLNDSDAMLYPVNLDEMFMVDGAVIQFQFGPTRAMQPEECGSNTKAVAVHNVVRMKQ